MKYTIDKLILSDIVCVDDIQKLNVHYNFQFCLFHNNICYILHQNYNVYSKYQEKILLANKQAIIDYFTLLQYSIINSFRVKLYQTLNPNVNPVSLLDVISYLTKFYNCTTEDFEKYHQRHKLYGSSYSYVNGELKQVYFHDALSSNYAKHRCVFGEYKDER